MSFFSFSLVFFCCVLFSILSWAHHAYIIPYKGLLSKPKSLHDSPIGDMYQPHGPPSDRPLQHWPRHYFQRPTRAQFRHLSTHGHAAEEAGFVDTCTVMHSIVHRLLQNSRAVCHSATNQPPPPQQICLCPNLERRPVPRVPYRPLPHSPPGANDRWEA